MSESVPLPPSPSADGEPRQLPAANSPSSVSSSLTTTPSETASPLQLEEVEQALLGAMLRNNRVYDDLSDRLSEEDFHHPAHQIIFRTLGNQSLKGQQSNALTLSYLLSDDETLEAQGGAEYLSFLENALLPSVPRDYARILRDLRLRRACGR